MQVYLDTSAAVPLILQEPHSKAAVSAWKHVTQAWAWQWMRVEAEAALIRRKAGPEAWRRWRALSSRIEWLSFDESLFDQVCTFNRSLGLRAADASHLFVCDRALRAVPSLTLLTFDSEMRDAAQRIGVPVFSS